MIVAARVGLVALAVTTACSPTGERRPETAPASTTVTVAPPAETSAEPADAGAPDAPPTVDRELPRGIDGAAGAELIFPGDGHPAAHREACPEAATDADLIRCWIAKRFDADARAQSIALELYASEGVVAGLNREQDMDGGYRGMLHLVPELPIGAERRHLGWVADAIHDFDAFFDGLARRAKDARPLRYRYKPIGLRFFRSVKRRTPSAYADGWDIAYNLAGSLHVTGAAVRETMFHEIFHLNDAAHGWWSDKTLSPVYDPIVAKCGTNMTCLRPYAPNDTTVRGGTYYAFQPGNGVGEYAAELAIRYYKEQRAIVRGEPPVSPPFKCKGREDAEAWRLIVEEFFGGIDLTPPC